MTEGRMQSAITRKLIGCFVFIGAVAALLVLFFSISFLSLSMRNTRQQPVNIIDVNVSNGLIFGSPEFLDHYQIGSFWGAVPGKSFSLEVEIQDAGVPKKFTCKASRRGSDSCLVEIYDHTVNCECYQ